MKPKYIFDSEMYFSPFTQNKCSVIIFLKESENMEERFVDLTTIPCYQQMVQVFYVDRCMAKWAGMLLSEHNEQLKSDQNGSR